MSYGEPGPGKWITIYSDPSHVFIVIGGIAFDTADYGGPNIPSGTGPRWRSNPLGNLADGGNYVVRHPAGYVGGGSAGASGACRRMPCPREAGERLGRRCGRHAGGADH